MARPATAFAGFGPKATEFFRELANNNERAWFLEHKAVYEREVVSPLQLLLAALISAFAERGLPLTGDPKKSIFRIHRDVRFSNDKLPYKTHAGAALTRSGLKGSLGVLYLHVAAAECFVAAGFWNPEREALDALREAIFAQPARFLAVQAGLVDAGLPLDMSDSLTRMPRGFEDAADQPVAPALKLKSFVVRRTIEIGSPGLVGEIVKFAEDARPLLDFGHAALTVLDPTRLK